ncbi:MAG: hypothetical protein JWO13_2175 [Acidobacteriales bacterium]|nr:hypothetical protein [Terriglobales bacterium]
MKDRSLLRRRRRDSPRKNSAGCLCSLLGSALHGWSVKPDVDTTKTWYDSTESCRYKTHVGGTLVASFFKQDRWLAAAPPEVIS